MNKTKLYLIGAFFFYAYFAVFFVVPLTDGWWDYYLYLHNAGVDIYNQSGLKLPPLYIEFLSLINTCFGNGFLPSRVLHAGIFFLTLWIIFGSIKGGSDSDKILGIAIAGLLLISNDNFLIKDYHVFQDLLVAILILFGSRFINKSILHNLAIGVLLGLIFSTKQNVGLFLAAMCITYSLAKDRNYLSLYNATKLTIALLAGFSLPIIALSFEYTGFLSAILVGNDSKGSPFKVIFRFALDSSVRKTVLISIGLIGLLAAINYYKSTIERILNVNAPSLANLFLAIIVVVEIFAGKSYMTFPIIAALNVIYLVKNMISSKDFFFGLVGLTIIYCGTQTAGFTNESVFFSAAYAMTYAIHERSNIKFKFDNKRIVNIIVILLSIIVISRKLTGPSYQWWGYKLAPIVQSSFKSPNPILDGLGLDRSTKQLLDLANDIPKNSKVFAFPSIPLVYLLRNQLIDFEPVLWFDVTGSRSDNKKSISIEAYDPDYIIWLRPPKSVYDAHFNMRGTDPAMLEVDNYIVNKYCNKEYVVEKAILPYEPYEMAVSAPATMVINPMSCDYDHATNRYNISEFKVDFKNINLYPNANAHRINALLNYDPSLYDSTEPIVYILKKLK